MANEILISVTREEIRVGLLEGGQVIEFYVERKRDASLVGNIYKGRVVKILPGMQSAFVDVGLEKAAFLYVADIMTDLEAYAPFLDEEEKENSIDLFSKRGRQDLPIEEIIQEGQELLVQVSKDPIGSKGARVTSYVTLPGRYLVLMPNVEHIGISRRISDEEERARLRAILETIKPRGYGFIIRTASEGCTEEELKKDMEFLLLLWENIQGKRDRVVAPTLLYSDLDLEFRSVRDLMSQDVERLVIDSEDEADRVKDFVKTYFPKLLSKIEVYNDSEPIFDAFGVELDISRALGRRVWLKSGGYIVVDQTEAMTVIDVNTGKFVGKEDLEDTILKTNLEAVKEIAYQIRLRNLGGIIIIDFIDMEKLENREKVFNAFLEAMKRDRAKNTILHISELGLIQMTRKRVRESLGRTLCEACPYCEGKGFVKSPRTLCYEIFRKITRMARHGGVKIIVTAHPSVAELLSDEERGGIEEIENKYGVKVIVKEDDKLHQENYEVMQL
ncbi:MAG TPA: Rne/Rng family ribonuclease [Thermodesulfovibrionales bacterium]|jgi:ribonuclease G|nr:Rne/Rng family ribonuclease [Thermodesulfovibrionales bacterium]